LHCVRPVSLDLDAQTEGLNPSKERSTTTRFMLQQKSERASTPKKVYQLDPVEDARWEPFVEQHSSGSVFHSGAWLRALRDTYGYDPVVFTTCPPTEELTNGIVFCRIRSWLTGSRLTSLPFSDHCEPLCNSGEELECLIQHLLTEREFHRYKYIQMRPVSEYFGKTGGGNGWLPADEYFLHILDLKPPLSELFATFDKDSVQRRIQRAERAGLSEKCGRTEALLEKFYRLFVLTRKRQGVPPTPYRWFCKLVEELGKSLEIRVAYKGDLPTAAILTLRFRDVVYYKYGCSDGQFNAYGATPWLFWQAITSAKSSGAAQFDFGRTELSNPGLLAFKNHWVAQPRRIAYWQYPSPSRYDLTEGWKQKFAKSFFSVMPSRLNVVMGNLLYRHFG